MISFFDFVNHRNGMIRIGDNAFASVIQRQFFAAEKIFSALAALPFAAATNPNLFLCPFRHMKDQQTEPSCKYPGRCP